MLTFIKFGGSVITDKSGREAADTATIATLAADLRAALAADPALRLILGHGSGSFGHYYAAQYGIHRGLAADADWMGFARTAGAALRLNRLVVDALLAADVPAISLQPSTSLRSDAGHLTSWLTEPIGLALTHRLVPVIHGDVAFDAIQGSAVISTEALFTHLALHSPFQPARIILVGEEAVFTADPRANPGAAVIPLIDGGNIAEVLHGTGKSHGADVTGGMRSKIELMWQLIQALPALQVRLIGPHPDLLRRTLLNEALDQGTLIKA
jgi:isopentenyl phosphate kinase